EFDHPWKLLRDRLRPRNSPHVRPECDLHSRLHRLAKRHFVLGGALAVALALRSVGRRPVAVVNTQRRAEPRALPDHLRDLSIGQHEAMLDRVATAVERALHSFSAVSVASHFLSPAMRL